MNTLQGRIWLFTVYTFFVGRPHIHSTWNKVNGYSIFSSYSSLGSDDVATAIRYRSALIGLKNKN
ncbi:hypothetical protein [Flammeovirga aprica]|uniref:Uncharacterized protein n=1 Tax=Flammeovirga aprica JL-4 TaxID=694437 RepID=A0A7X9XBN7_9BACT|nr:hypothetical protein [Flammeovirga aprica]NME70799.1 hypothetical protein [Flammeovirga aprica JL-4]